VARRLEPQHEDAPQERLVDVAARDLLPILLVDDRPENLHTLEAVLEPLGFPLVTASSGGEALRLLLAHDFSLILLDVRMPGLDGLETAELIKGRGRSSEVPIVFLTAARDEVQDIIRGYGIGAVDYVLKPFDPELLRSKVAVFAELETNRRALKRSEALLRGAFEAAPIGKTLLDSERRILRANPAFARLVGLTPEEVQGKPVADLCHSDDVPALWSMLDRAGEAGDVERERETVDLRLHSRGTSEVWVAAVVSLIEPTELATELVMVQWVDLTARRRAERARADLLLEQAARAQAEAMAHRLTQLQALSHALEALSLEELLPELAVRLVAIHDVPAAEVQIGEQSPELAFRATADGVSRVGPDEDADGVERWEEAPLQIERARLGTLRVALAPGRSFDPEERALLREAADRVALSIRRAQLHEEEHRIAVELQRGLIPAQLPSVPGVELAAHYEAAGLGAEVGGDWYDAFALPSGRLGIVLGDVAGSGIRAASTMGQLRSVTRAFALADEAVREPGEVLTRLNSYRAALDEHQLFTVLYAVIDPTKRTIAWASAGHPPPLVARSGGDVGYLEGGDGLMGVEEEPYATRRSELAPRDLLLLYTDGLIERRGESLDAGMERLAQTVAAGPGEPDELRAYVLEQLVGSGSSSHSGPDAGPADDVTAVVVKVA
jgi:PAS domain S-box-containing protein